MVWNKHGASRGGASTGRDGVKRGGKDDSAASRADPDTAKNDSKRGGRIADLQPIETADCAICNGTGKTGTDRLEVDEDGGYVGTQERTCVPCGGTGRVTRKNRS
ncbi:Molecular chaperone DnaJ [Frankia sp. AgKG'84/4]